jgi:hypothetical protein
VHSVRPLTSRVALTKYPTFLFPCIPFPSPSIFVRYLGEPAQSAWPRSKAITPRSRIVPASQVFRLGKLVRWVVVVSEVDLVGVD